MTTTIRQATINDLDNIYNIWQAEMTRALPGASPNNDHIDYFRGKLESQCDTFRTWVAEDTETRAILGWMSLSPFINNPVIRPAFAEVSTYVMNGKQGEGVGALLTDTAIKHAKQHTSLIALVGVIHSENTAAIALAKKANCTEAGSIPAFSSHQPPIPELKIFVCRI
ncbi:MAG: GNAT family N-acetyltransferase [Nitrospira sp.]|jgi:L-amino acid N-acyltransferase YncA|nr:MAG: GNAT family N-acetyltransferase [Nitrospira sp.]